MGHAKLPPHPPNHGTLANAARCVALVV